MFSKVLIANRGEIALRLIRTCRRMGIATVAVYSQVDARSLHVQMADEAYFIGPAAPSQSYLNMGRILDVAEKAGAEAVHPGYGFLSENSDFVRACRERGVVFIGPSADVMEKMRDKVQARGLAKEAGLPILPGTDEEVNEENAPRWARDLGFPLMVKPTVGGGGIGTYIVHSPEELPGVMEKARRLAQEAFGNPSLYMERYLEGAWHLEVQVLGDDYGNLVHLYERDCSLQRRYQKVVEESPSIKLSPEERKRLTEYALALVRHIGYTNAGTVEFLASRDGTIYFLEMNMRLQVEHGVTEAVTGLDLAELQMRVAAGEPLPLSQQDVKLNGHAVEARIYPEDPETFMPSAGVVWDVQEPSGEHIRVDSSLYPRYEVTTHYEPLLAKVIAWGLERKEALRRLYHALRSYRIDGVKTNIPTLRSVITHVNFRRGRYDTGFLSRVAGTPRRERTVTPVLWRERRQKELAAAIGLALVLSEDSHPNGHHASIPEEVVPSKWRLQTWREPVRSWSREAKRWR